MSLARSLWPGSASAALFAMYAVSAALYSLASQAALRRRRPLVALDLAGLQHLRDRSENDRHFRAEMKSALSGYPVAARLLEPSAPCSTPKSTIPSHITMSIEARESCLGFV
jgi:hypothetical protein